MIVDGFGDAGYLLVDFVVEVAVEFPHIVYNFIVKYRLYIFKVIIL